MASNTGDNSSTSPVPSVDPKAAAGDSTSLPTTQSSSTKNTQNAESDIREANSLAAPNTQDASKADHVTHPIDNLLTEMKKPKPDSRGILIAVLNIRLTDCLPHAGYFAAGAVAGVVSRTATAPLDRMKVYLIASIGSANGSLDAAKKGDAIVAARRLGQPLIDATRALWKAGGVRSLFAGKSRLGLAL